MSSSVTGGTRDPSWPGEERWAGGWVFGPGHGVDHIPCSLLKVHLQLHGFSVFIDVEKLEAGKFEDKLIQSVMAARNFVLVLSAGALDKCMQDNDCKDWVHKVGAGLGRIRGEMSPGAEGDKAFPYALFSKHPIHTQSQNIVLAHLGVRSHCSVWGKTLAAT